MLKYVGSYAKDAADYPVRHVWQSEAGFLVNKEFGPDQLTAPSTMKLWSGSSLDTMVQHWSTQRQIHRPVQAANSFGMLHGVFHNLLQPKIPLRLPPDAFVTEESIDGAVVVSNPQGKPRANWLPKK